MNNKRYFCYLGASKRVWNSMPGAEDKDQVDSLYYITDLYKSIFDSVI